MSTCALRSFFVPPTHHYDLNQSESLYHAIKSYVVTTNHYQLSSRRIFKLSLETRFSTLVINTEIQVGERLNEKGETVLAIFEVAEG
jgi:hypothetical protein